MSFGLWGGFGVWVLVQVAWVMAKKKTTRSTGLIRQGSYPYTTSAGRLKNARAAKNSGRGQEANYNIYIYIHIYMDANININIYK